MTQSAVAANPAPPTLTEEQVLEEMRLKLDRTVLPWEADGCHPPRYMRRKASVSRDGLVAVLNCRGVVSVVDSRVGGFNDECHYPEYIGWSVSCPRYSRKGIVTLDELRDADVRASAGMTSIKFHDANGRITNEAKAALFRLAFLKADKALVQGAQHNLWSVKGAFDFSGVRVEDGGE